jgi:hypothetical protein
MHDTFWTLLGDRAHWEFEIFLIMLFDGLLAGIFWPFLRKHWGHHIARDRAGDAAQVVVPPIECFSCAGSTVLLDTSVVICKECGHVTVPSK